MNKETIKKMAKLTAGYFKKVANDPEKLRNLCAVTAYQTAYEHMAAIWQSAFTEILVTDYFGGKLDLTEEQKNRIDELYKTKLGEEAIKLKELLKKSSRGE